MSLSTPEFIRERDKLRKAIEAVCGPGIERTVTFTNDDVPNFLKELDEFEKRPARSILIK